MSSSKRAAINQIPVEGFGWIVRDGLGWQLRGEYHTYSDFVASGLASTIDLQDARRRLADGVFSKSQGDTIEQLAIEEVESATVTDVSFLAHGDIPACRPGALRRASRSPEAGCYRPRCSSWTARPWFQPGFRGHACSRTGTSVGTTCSLIPAIGRACSTGTGLRSHCPNTIRGSRPTARAPAGCTPTPTLGADLRCVCR